MSVPNGTETPAPLTGRTAELALHALIVDECLDNKVLDYLLPEGKPHSWEGPLWDYKAELPSTSGRGSSESGTPKKVLELIKDVVSFYNSFGGYIVAGVDQYAASPIVGCDNLDASGFTVEKLNEKLRSYTRTNITCRFRALQLEGGETVGLLLVPMRPAADAVTQFVRGASQDLKGAAPFQKGDIYARIDDTCVPVHEDVQGIQFVCSPRSLHADGLRQLDNNLPPKDPDLIRFVGRAEYLMKLWGWLLDRHTPVKVLSAMGGTGKTSIAYEFARQLLSGPPAHYEKVIWLTAKRQTFSAIQGRYVGATRTDFSDPNGLLAALSSELGASKEEIADAGGRAGLLDLVMDGLRLFPALVVIDDVDTLPVEQQADLFSTVQVVAGRAFSYGSRFLLTSRLELGAGEDQLIRVRGFGEKEFAEFVKMVATERSISLNDGVIKRLHTASLGSPIFAASILRLVTLGTDINTAVRQWKGKAGEDVRRFAFQRELEELTDAQARTLYALSVLGETTHLELCQILNADTDRIDHDLGVLRQYHLFAASGDPSTGAKLVVPEPIRLMTDILRARVADPSRIDKECARARSTVPKVQDRVAIAIASILSLWKADDYDAALLTAEQAKKANAKSGDLHCMYGQALLKVTPARAEAADKAFRAAFNLGCSRPELIPNWLEAKKLTRDWTGIYELHNTVPPPSFRGQSVVAVLEAFDEIGRQQVGRGDRVRALDTFEKAMLAASRSIGEQRAGDQLGLVRDYCRDAARNYVQLKNLVADRPRDKVDVFNAVMDAFSCHVTETWMIDLALTSLVTWADAIDGTGGPDERALDILERRTEDLRTVRKHLENSAHPRTDLSMRVRKAETRLDTMITRSARLRLRSH